MCGSGNMGEKGGRGFKVTLSVTGLCGLFLESPAATALCFAFLGQGCYPRSGAGLSSGECAEGPLTHEYTQHASNVYFDPF